MVCMYTVYICTCVLREKITFYLIGCFCTSAFPQYSDLAVIVTHLFFFFFLHKFVDSSEVLDMMSLFNMVDRSMMKFIC